MITRSVVLLLLATAANSTFAQEGSGRVAIVPQPRVVIPLKGRFLLTAKTQIVANDALTPIAWQLLQSLAPATGYALAVRASIPAGGTAIDLKIDSSLNSLGDEGYQLEVRRDRISIRAARPPGLFYAFQSLLQLLPPQIFRQAKVSGIEWAVPCVRIEDVPRFAWRGALLDAARHFMPKSSVKRFIDLLALHKLNVFHWHLTDDQGWRIEIKKYPKLTEVGAWRRETLVGHFNANRDNPKFDGIPHGGFYTQEDIREIVEYARVRNVTIVPEIEIPGHATAAIAAYPELGNTQQPVAVSRQWGVHENIFNVNESTIRFLQEVLLEVLELFPSKFIHVGGDEAVKTLWKSSPAAQARIAELGLRDEEELQSWFIRQMDEFLTTKGRRLVGWDEILQGGLAPNATVMSWRGEEGGIAAAKSGHKVVMTPSHSTYLDYYQSKDTSRKPLAIGNYLPLEVVYAYEPVPAALSPEDWKRVLGTQGQIWTEFIPDFRHAEYMAFPRLCALAEVAWSSRDRKSYPDFLRRLSEHLKRLDVLDVNYRRLDP